MPNEKTTAQQIPIAKIHDLPGVSTEKLADKSYGGLVATILLDGVKEPVILRQREDGEYQLVAGYRRRKAAELAKLKELPALIYDMTEKEAQEYHKIANTSPDAPIPGKLIEKSAKTLDVDVQETKTVSAKKEEETAPPTSAKAAEEKKAKNRSETAKAEKPAGSPTEKKAAEPAKQRERAESAKSSASAAEAKTADVEKSPVSAKTPAKKKESDDKPVGMAAVGPTGTLITKLLGEKLSPPTVKDKKSLPVPGEGEAFAVTLHPAYLKKADINTFSVDRNSDDFKELFQSIKRFGVKDPVLARFGKDGELEIISGQRRHLIASELNYPVPTIIQQLDDDDARILVADGNLHREHISTYDLSRAVKMKSESMKHKVGRRSKFDTGPKKQYTDETIAAEMGMSTAKLNRLMKLSEATKQICDLVDENTIPLSVAYNIAFLKPEVQDMVGDLIGINIKVNNENTNKLKEVAKAEALDYEKVRGVLEGKYPPPKVVEKPKPVEPAKAPEPAATPAGPSMVSTNIPKSPDVPAPPKADKVVPFPAAVGKETEPQPIPKAKAPAPAEPTKASEGQDRENSYATKIILTGDRLRKYFPDVSMTPREIEDSVYDALEERRQRQEKTKQKAEIFNKDKKAPGR